MELIDTNVLVRVLAQDQPEHAARASRFLEQVGVGERTATITKGVFVEVVQVLSTKRLYSRPREEIRAFLHAVVELRGLRLPQEALYRRALDLYVEENIDFVDALNVAHVERAHWGAIVSFDRHYRRIASVVSREP